MIRFLFLFALLRPVLPAAGQVPDVPPAFAHPDTNVAKKYPGPQALYRFLFPARANYMHSGGCLSYAHQPLLMGPFSRETALPPQT